jgi:uncharacterized protein with ParB-like and HNH nuclease domain
MSDFTNNLHLLPNIFKDKFFVIPDYQRGYAWGDEQVQELLSDIEHQIFDGHNNKHYTGTLVLLNKGNRLYEVVDGQQRLTTLSILLNCVRRKYLTNEKDLESGREFTSNYIIRGGLGQERPVLQLNADTHKSYESVVIRGEEEPQENLLESQKRIFSANRLIADWLNNRKDPIPYDMIMHTLENELGFLIYCPTTDVETGVMFEVINNRGQKLSELEKVKNYLIYCSVKLDAGAVREEINQAWALTIKRLNFSGKISMQDETSFLRYCLVLFFQSGFSDSKSGYDDLKSKININLDGKDKKEKLIRDIREFVEFIASASLWYARLFNYERGGLNQDLIQILDKISWQPTHAPVMPLFISIMLKKNVDDQCRIKLLNIIELLNFRVYVTPGITSRTDAYQPILYMYANEFFRDKLVLNLDLKNQFTSFDYSSKSQEWVLECNLVKFVLDYCPDDVFPKAFDLSSGKRSGFDYYRWSGLKYFLMNYEQHIDKHRTVDFNRLGFKSIKGKGNDALSVEHIWAQKNCIRSAKNGKIEDSKEDAFEKKRLGNFVLLEQRLNTQGSNLEMKDKFEIYVKGEYSEGNLIKPPSQLLQIKMVGKMIADVVGRPFSGARKNVNNFKFKNNKDVIDANENILIEFAVGNWAIDKISNLRSLIVDDVMDMQSNDDDD